MPSYALPDNQKERLMSICRPTCILGLISLIFTAPVGAQIAPDPSVGTTVTPDVMVNGVTSEVIDGGTIRGANLFHSFSEFNINTGRGAYFTNPEGITNIFSRITGNNPSNINGILGVLGNANLFLLNPNGMIFGPNARLDLNGSFLATTANTFNFADGTQFSAINPQVGSLLTVSVPIGLGFGSNPAPIQVQGTGHSLTEPAFSNIIRDTSLTGLQVEPQRTLALVGGNIDIAGGKLIAQSGLIELGSVGNGSVSLSHSSGDWKFDYSGVDSFRDIHLSQQALLDASGMGGGAINLQAQRISLRDGSMVLIQNQGLQSGGNISVKATQSVEIIGTTPNESISSGFINETAARGNGGDITVSTGRLLIENGGAINARTTSQGAAGNIVIDASELVEVIGVSPVFKLYSLIGTATVDSGAAGNITLLTQRLTVLNGAIVGSNTFGLSNASGGDVTINASESIEVAGSVLTSATMSAGGAASLTLNTRRLIVRDGGGINVSTYASGAAGSVTVNASESIEISGTVPGSRNPSLIISSANIADQSLQQLFRLPPIPTGASGEVTINTARLVVTDGAQVTVKNEGPGDAGTLRVNASEIFLADQGGISASTASGNGGNIVAQANSLQMRRGGSITTTAGGTGNGGNITLDVNTIAMLENSDITANAVVGRGGNIAIATDGLFRSVDSEITASSQLGISGVVNISSLSFEQQNLRVEQSNEFVDADTAASSCLARGNDGSGMFQVTGNGGLPETPNDALVMPYELVWVRSDGTSNANQMRQQPSKPAATTWKLGDPIVEATEFTVHPDGQIELTAKRNTEAAGNAIFAEPHPLPCQPN